MAINNTPRSYQAWSAIGATPNDFNLDAGLYGLTVSAGVWGSGTLQKLNPDGVTYAAVAPASVANGYSTLQLPAGQYRMLLAGVAAFSGVIELISRGPMR